MTQADPVLKSVAQFTSSEWKQYPRYRDSGTAWLGNVPEHWDCLPHRAMFQEFLDRGHPDAPMLSVTIGRGVIPQSELLTDSSKKDSSNTDKSKYKFVRPGDLVYNKMRAWQGAIGVSGFSGIVSPAYIVVRPRKPQNTRYFHYLFRTPAFATEAERWSYGITSDQWSLRSEDFKRIYSVRPPLSDQDAIVHFLSHYDRLIHKYIQAKQKQIALLTEQKQAIIQRTVTHGLNPNVRLKPSGVEWLGNIPEHWEVSRCKYLFREVDRRSTTGTEVLLSLRMHQGLVPHTEVSEKPISTAQLVGYKKVRPGEFVMNRMRAAIGMFAVAHMKGLVSPDYAVFIARTDLVPEYYLHLFKTPLICGIFRLESRGLGTGSSGFLRLYSESFGGVAVPVPTPEEQKAIVAIIDRDTAPLSEGIASTEREIALMREYRTALTTDVVTGKIDVREAATMLPVVADESSITDIDFDEIPDEEEVIDAD